MPSSSTRPSARQHEEEDDALAQAAALKARLISALDATDPVYAAELRNELESPAQAAENPEPRRPRPAPRKSRAAASANADPAESNLTPLERHSRKCKICNLPNREAFEADFLDWCQASWLQQTYHIRDESTIYRHARATGLLQRRRENLRMVAEKVLEHVDTIDTPSAFAILRAVRTLACLNERGHWTEPPTTHIVVNTTNPPAQSANPVTSGASAQQTLSSSATEPVACDSLGQPSTTSHSSSAAEPHAAQVVMSRQNSFESNGSSSDSRRPMREPSSLEPPAPSLQNPNRQSYEKLELDVTDTKQTPEVVSNRQSM